MPCYLYVLRNIENERWYIGTAEVVSDRLLQHNQGLVRSTKAFRPWKLMYTERHENRAKARYREWALKHSAHQRQVLFKEILH